MEEKFTSVFRSDIDLKAHRANVHGRALGKAATKQARTLELEFTLAPRPRGNAGYGHGHSHNHRRQQHNKYEIISCGKHRSNLIKFPVMKMMVQLVTQSQHQRLRQPGPICRKTFRRCPELLRLPWQQLVLVVRYSSRGEVEDSTCLRSIFLL
jgi:hypothetical protein